MATPSTLPRIAILALAESTASFVYGMFDLFRSANRDWGMIVCAIRNTEKCPRAPWWFRPAA